MPEEPCQCPDCQRFYREHDRLIRDFPTLRQQQEQSWASLQSFRTLAGKVLEDLQKQQSSIKNEISSEEKEAKQIIDTSSEERQESLLQAIVELETINAHLFSIEVLMERIFDAKVPESVENKFREVAGELAPDPLNLDRLRLNRLLHQTPDLPDKGLN